MGVFKLGSDDCTVAIHAHIFALLNHTRVLKNVMNNKYQTQPSVNT